MNESITFTVKPADAKKAGFYVDNHNCLLCVAAKRELKREDISASSTTVTIGGIIRHFGDDVFRSVRRAYGPGYSGKPKVKKAFTVTLT